MYPNHYQYNSNGYNDYFQLPQMNGSNQHIYSPMSSSGSSASDSVTFEPTLLRTDEASAYRWSSPCGSNINFHRTTPESTTVTENNQNESFVNNSSNTEDYQAAGNIPFFPAEESRPLVRAKRVMFNARQIQQMENVFPYYNNRIRSYCPEMVGILDTLAEHSGVSTKQAKTWFRNKRFKMRQQNEIIDRIQVPQRPLPQNGCVCCYYIDLTDADDENIPITKPTTADLKILENVYETEQYIAQKPGIMKELVHQTQLSTEQLVEWFLKRRNAQRKSECKEVELNIASRERMEKIEEIKNRLEDQTKVFQSYGNLRAVEENIYTKKERREDERSDVATKMGFPDEGVCMSYGQFMNGQLAKGQATLLDHNYAAPSCISTPQNYQQVPNHASNTFSTSDFGNSEESYASIDNQAFSDVLSDETYNKLLKEALDDLCATNNDNSIQLDRSFDLDLFV